MSSRADIDAMRQAIESHREELGAAMDHLASLAGPIAAAAAMLTDTLRAGSKILVAGNGGSAAEAQHFSAELVGRFKRERAPLAALALTADTAILTAVANDYSYEDVFARQVLGLGRAGDVLLGFSTSGESENLVRAADAAHQRDLKVLMVVGPRPSRLAEAADLALRAPGDDTTVIQEIHTVITHLVCDVVEMAFSS